MDVVNSFDGSTSLKIFFGVGRIVCLNGMVIGDIDCFKYVHRGNKIYQNIENDYDKIVAKLLGTKERVRRLNNVFLPPQAVDRIIHNIASKVFNVDSKTRKVEVVEVSLANIESLLETHRGEDNFADAWTQMNVIQENIIRNGRLSALVMETDKEKGTNVLKDRQKRGNEFKMSSFELNAIISNEFLQAVA